MAGRGEHLDRGRSPTQALAVGDGRVNWHGLGQHQVVRVQVVEMPAAGGIVPVGLHFSEMVFLSGRNDQARPGFDKTMCPAGLVAMVVGEQNLLDDSGPKLRQVLRHPAIAAVHEQRFVAVQHDSHVHRPAEDGQMLAQSGERRLLGRGGGGWGGLGRRGSINRRPRGGRSAGSAQAMEKLTS